MPGATTEPGPETLSEVSRGGVSWPLGKATDVAWVAARTSVGRTVNSAVPPVFAAYATVVIPQERCDQVNHDAALMSVLRAHAGDQRWWIRYLDTGVDDIVFPAAPRTELYLHWPSAARRWHWRYLPGLESSSPPHRASATIASRRASPRSVSA